MKSIKTLLQLFLCYAIAWRGVMLVVQGAKRETTPSKTAVNTREEAFSWMGFIYVSKHLTASWADDFQTSTREYRECDRVLY